MTKSLSEFASRSPGPGRATRLTVDLAAVVHNYRVGQQATGPEVALWPVVKADGYGLGALPIAKALREAGAPGLCVALVEEAAALRGAGVTGPLILLSGLAGAAPGQLAGLDVQPFLYEPRGALDTLAGLPPGRGLSVHVKVDTGMGRLGLSPEAVPDFLEALDRLGDRIRPVGLVSHLACADEPARPETARQIEILETLLRHPRIAPRGLRVSMANSAGLLAHPGARGHWARPGIMLYGSSPFYPAADWRAAGLRPVVTWTSRVAQISEKPAGTPLGYGHTHTTVRPSRLAQVPVGYGDGYNRRLGNRAQVLAGGTRAPVVGRVCMDLITVDITHLPQVGVGDPITLLGRDGEEFISVEEMAGWLDTIPYEVTCALGRRVPRTYRTVGDS
ncbi:MAG: alanine racemase [Magnetococcales bacterium]|nr:alanine racemase [Magnetococcales bacterium]